MCKAEFEDHGMVVVSGNFSVVNDLQGQVLMKTLAFMLDVGITLTSAPVSTRKRPQE